MIQRDENRIFLKEYPKMVKDTGTIIGKNINGIIHNVIKNNNPILF